MTIYDLLYNLKRFGNDITFCRDKEGQYRLFLRTIRNKGKIKRYIDEQAEFKVQKTVEDVLPFVDYRVIIYVKKTELKGRPIIVTKNNQRRRSNNKY